MRIVFRADASLEIGAGHVMRSSAIAEEAISRGVECIFVGAFLEIEWLARRIQTLGFTRITNPDDFDFQEYSDILIVDSYSLDLNDPLIRFGKWRKVVSIVDELTPDYPHELAIHPGLDGNWYTGTAKFLSGPNYIPLRKSIKWVNCEPALPIKQIAVFGGGTDTFKFSNELAEILHEIDGFQSAIFFSSDKESIEKLDPRYSVYDLGSHLDETISNSELVITTASTSSLETIARGIPVAIACAVPNQDSYYDAIGKLGLATLIGRRFSKNSWNIDILELSNLVKDLDSRKKMISRNRGIIDLNGSSRIVDEIIRFTI